MKINEFNEKVETLGYRLEINRVESDATEDYNRVLIFDDNKPFSIAIIYKEEGHEAKLETADKKLIKLIQKFSATPFAERDLRRDTYEYGNMGISVRI